ncbi:signal peptidase I [Rossellomorea aquimaris]|uniref:signal peptidase I n=1 Tax=Rossellomorea aquimaris TaxID=189382 RepID=UPI001CD279CA|nr:signal peptidase I [Rossellomorea aquimaris]MCA1061491.1 signal peptidase I [Rossellomorea aquimaris]
MLADQEAVHLISNVMKKHKWIDLPAHGISMFPYIQDGDVCTFVTCSAAELQKGDTALYHTVQGKLVTHRFVKQQTINDDTFYMFKGDTNLGFDEPIGDQQVIGKLVYIKRRRRKISAGSVRSILWSKAILSLPYLSQWLRSYLNRRNTVRI